MELFTSIILGIGVVLTIITALLAVFVFLLPYIMRRLARAAMAGMDAMESARLR